ncbi:MAG: bifunctional demethylmenaquinone methyltransferase/2-methoxy-6-polyprenyl-1,4-benzoquinol methylase UbiE [Bryobacterales bacterium]|nr:bifunctional demethylmenaquinone methyltransferase/2-methoxy-6-polyprenyl-1,4-benzoquinol methylase UbiE [Bryobacterales bacterium]
MKAAGTTPLGAAGEEQTSRWVREMFDGVARRYDVLNHLLSFNLDKRWRARTVRRLRPILSRPDSRVLDLCCGTGDMLIAMEQEAQRKLYGSDFCHPMLTAAREKLGARQMRSQVVEGDALRLAFRDGTFDLVTVAFGVRNFANYAKGFGEIRRVLKPGGTFAILEFSHPPNPLIRWGNNVYCNKLLPVVGGLISGSRKAYSYLPSSVSKFPDAGQLSQILRDSGFQQVTYQHMTFGVVALHLARKA